MKEALYTYRDGVIKISIKPYEESVSIDLRKTWFRDKIRGLDLGELILKRDELIVTARKQAEL